MFSHPETKQERKKKENQVKLEGKVKTGKSRYSKVGESKTGKK